MNAPAAKPKPNANTTAPGWAAIERRARAMAAADAMLDRLADELGLTEETRRELGIVSRRAGGK